MSRFIKLLESLLLPTIALFAFLISIADFFGLLSSVPWLSIHITALTLLVISLVLSSLSMTQSRFLDLHKDIQNVLVNAELESMQKSLEQVDPDLRKIFEDDFIDLLKTFKLAVHENKIQLNDGLRYRYYYLRTLQFYPKATFLATSFPTVSYLWKSNEAEDAIARFIRNGGKMVRIFFVRGIDELNSLEIQEILKRQYKMGVKVYIANIFTTPNELRRNIFVEAKGKIGWETFMNNEQQLGTSIITTNKYETQRFCRILRKLLDGEVQQYVPND